MENEAEGIEADGTAELRGVVSGAHLAYVIYTSGIDGQAERRGGDSRGFAEPGELALRRVRCRGK